MTERYEYERQIRALRKIILDGISYFIAWRSLNEEYEESVRNYREHKGFWWRYRGFFAPARNALLWSTLLQVAKAYDTDPRTVSLRNLLVTARNSQTECASFATPDSLEDIQARIVRDIGLLRKLRRYRNRRLVHYDSTEMENVDLPAEDVATLVDETMSIFNSLKHSCDGAYDDFEGIMGDVSLHTSQVISIMREAEKANP